MEKSKEVEVLDTQSQHDDARDSIEIRELTPAELELVSGGGRKRDSLSF